MHQSAATHTLTLLFALRRINEVAFLECIILVTFLFPAPIGVRVTLIRLAFRVTCDSEIFGRERRRDLIEGAAHLLGNQSSV